MALLALALQLVASFGHVHPEDLFSSRQSLTIVATGNAAADGDADQHEHDGFCSLCWGVQLLGNARIAVPPLLPVAVVFRRTAICVPPPNPLTLADCQAFQSRAPPRA